MRTTKMFELLKDEHCKDVIMIIIKGKNAKCFDLVHEHLKEVFTALFARWGGGSLTIRSILENGKINNIITATTNNKNWDNVAGYPKLKNGLGLEETFSLDKMALSDRRSFWDLQIKAQEESKNYFTSLLS